MPIISNDSPLVQEIMRLLGLDKDQVYSFTLRVQVDRAPVLLVTRYIEDFPGELETKKYKLVWEELVDELEERKNELDG